jgi:hypothetical protein
MIKKKFCASNSDIIRLGDEVYKLIKSYGYDCEDSIVSLERLNHFVEGVVKDKLNIDRGVIVNDCYCDRCGNPK